ncbi:MAG: tetratricopeptide repeat protein [Ignavibacteriaceae bacterium]
MDYKFLHKIKCAKEFEAQGKYLHAIQVYQLLIEEFPEFPESYINLADIYQIKGMKKSAEKILKLILNRQPDNYEIKLYYVQFLMHNEEWDEALNLLLSLSIEDPFASYLTGYCYFSLNDYELAKVYLLGFIISDEEPELIHEAYLILAKLELELNQYENALKYAKKAEVMYDDDWELQLIISKIYYYLKMYTHSFDSINKGIKLNKKEAVLYKWAGKINLKLVDYNKAKKYFEKHIDLKKDITSNDYTYLADACLKSGKLNEALNFFNTAIRLDPKNKMALEGKGKTNDLLNKKLASDV